MTAMIETTSGVDQEECSPAWQQLSLPLDDVPILSMSIEELLLLEDVTSTALHSDIPRHMLCSVESLDGLVSVAERTAGGDDQRQRNVNLVKKLCAQGGRERRLRPLPMSWRRDLAALERSFPNFAEVLSYVRSMGALAELGTGVLRVDPMLLDGPPGTGKSTFAEALGEIAAGGVHRVSMSAAETGAQIGGSAETWSNTQTGLVFNSLVDGVYANPMIVLDELDKASSEANDRFAPTGALYDLLEPGMARRFRDISVPSLVLNASAIVWIATSNECRKIPPALLHRLTPFEISPPLPGLASTMVRSVMDRLTQSEPVLGRFTISDEAVSKLTGVPPRTMRMLLRRACGRAAEAARWTVHAGDVAEQRERRNQIGFMR